MKISRFKNPIFILGIIGVIFSAAGIDLNSLTNWSLFIEGLESIIKNPVAIIAVLTALIGVFTDPSTKGIRDSKEVK